MVYKILSFSSQYSTGSLDSSLCGKIEYCLNFENRPVVSKVALGLKLPSPYDGQYPPIALWVASCPRMGRGGGRTQRPNMCMDTSDRSVIISPWIPKEMKVRIYNAQRVKYIKDLWAHRIWRQPHDRDLWSEWTRLHAISELMDEF